MNKELRQIKSRSFISVISLVSQSGYAAILGFFAFFVLTMQSGAFLLGIYNTVLAMISFFNYFTNLGLGAAIMQKKEVSELDLNSAFYIQLALTILAVLTGFLLGPKLFQFYPDLPQSAIYLYWAVLIAFFMLSLKSIPSILMEKEIEIYKVVSVQAIENTIFYISIILLVILGYEIFALVVAVILRAVFGLVLIFLLKPWRPRLVFSLKVAINLLKYGLPFQSNSFLALIKDDLLIIYLGSAIGFANLGIVSFAKKYAEFSIRLIMDNINRVAFPLFSRFQDNNELLKKSLHKVIFYESLLILPIIFGAIFIFDSLLKIVPGYFIKWNVALTSFYFFSFSSLFVSFSTPLINLFNAIGKVKLSVMFMILWTTILWLSVVLLISVFGYTGISVAFFLMSLTFILVLHVSKKYVSFSLWKFIKEPVIATLFMIAYLSSVRYLSVNIMSSYLLHVILSLLGAPLIYFYILKREKGSKFISYLVELVKFNND